MINITILLILNNSRRIDSLTIAGLFMNYAIMFSIKVMTIHIKSIFGLILNQTLSCKPQSRSIIGFFMLQLQPGKVSSRLFIFSSAGKIGNFSIFMLRHFSSLFIRRLKSLILDVCSINFSLKVVFQNQIQQVREEGIRIGGQRLYYLHETLSKENNRIYNTY